MISESRGILAHSHRVLGVAHNNSPPPPVAASNNHSSRFFDGISRQDLGPKDNRASNSDENPQVEGAQQSINP